MATEHSRSKRIAWHRQVCAAAAALALAACATMDARTAADYDNGKVPAEKLSKDADSCTKQAEAHTKQYGLGPYDMTHGSYNFMFDSCMQAGGYERQKKP